MDWSRGAADKPGHGEEDTRPEGREVVEMKGGRPGPRRHICHKYSPGACGAWESHQSPPKLHPHLLRSSSSPSTGLGLALPGQDPGSQTWHPDSVTQVLFALMSFPPFICRCVSLLSLTRSHMNCIHIKQDHISPITSSVPVKMYS